ncbi:hypothetical protein [Streptomyces sp. NBC_00347]|uniref:hypothetical protein n=1 Tax=Streptomyces sp. NBC_00347 TaxID=2975721 RepID=UPI002254A0C4|nr:hypothetical protein [Streptomyces sp. NBC_00347]MCX5129878.1 hypothetical protein [Streptomyces sp. NBC_00347]
MSVNMLQIVGVHGIRQGSSATTAELSRKWQASVDDALADSGHAATAGPIRLTVPSYQGVYPKTATRYMRLGPGSADAAEDAPVGEEEEEFILQALAAYAPSAVAEEDDSPMGAQTLGEGRLTPRILRRARAVDRVAGRGVTDRLLWLVREAHGYLRHEETGAAVRAEVRAALAATGARMVIAHSLGSVVFYDMLSRGEVPSRADGSPAAVSLITCGSPLSWLAVRNGVHTAGAPLSVPAGVEWTNLYAPYDPVNRRGGLSHLAVGVTDIEVDNGKLNAHDVHRYLDKPAVTERVAKARYF